MGFDIKPGEVFLGHEAGIGHKKGEEVDILGQKFRIVRILKERGSKDDIMIAMHLKDAQTILKKPGKITEIMALNCKCKTVNRLAEIREQLEKVLPEAKVTEWGSKAMVRAEQRKNVAKHREDAIRQQAESDALIQAKEEEKQQQLVDEIKENRESGEQQLLMLTRVVTPLVVLICAAWVGLLAWSNVRQRRAEIGLLRALGKGTANIAALLLGKAVLLGIIGGTIGCLVGLLIAWGLARGPLDIAAGNFPIPTLAIVLTIVGAPLLSALASYPPAMIAIGQDPAVVLREE